MKRTLLAAALTFTTLPAFAAGLTADELKFQRAMAEADPQGYADAVKFCDRDEKKTEDQRIECWRIRLSAMASTYAAEEKTVNAHNPTQSWTKLERALFRQFEGAAKKPEDRTPEEKEYAQLRQDMDAWVSDPKNKANNKEGRYVAVFRDPLQKMMKSYADNAKDFSLTKQMGVVLSSSKEQARVARHNPSGVFHGDINNRQLNTTPGDGVRAEAGPDDASRAAGQITQNDSDRPTPGDSKEPPLDNLEPGKVEGKADKNKWNNEIAGLKGGVWAGLIALILGGPVGGLLFGAIGFGAFTAISKHNNQ